MNARLEEVRDRFPSLSPRLPTIFVIVVLGCATIEPVLLTGANVKSALATYVVEVALVTAGQALVMTTGGIDLSVAGAVDLIGICVGMMSADGRPTIVLLGVGVGVGVACGAFNGIVVTRLGVPPIMVTLATGILYRGIAEGLANGQFYSSYPADFTQLGQGQTAGLPTQAWIALVALVLVGVLMGMTRYGRWVYATGANLRAAKLSGVPVDGARAGVYVASGFLCALATLIMSARLNSAGPNMGVGLELASITAAVLGGVSVFGGKGTVLGAVLGVLTIAALRSGLTLHEVATEIQNLGIAALLLLGLLIERVSLPRLVSTWRMTRPSSDPPPEPPPQAPPGAASAAYSSAPESATVTASEKAVNLP